MLLIVSTEPSGQRRVSRLLGQNATVRHIVKKRVTKISLMRFNAGRFIQVLLAIVEHKAAIG